MTRRIDNPDTNADIELRGILDASVRTSFIMVAGAGSGKTTSLIKALEHIGKKFGAEMRRRNQQVACITYTDVAVQEIKEDVGNNPLFHISTIHSFLWELVKPFQKDISAWVKQRMADKLEQLRQKSDSFGPRVRQTTIENTKRDIASLIAMLKTIGGVKRFTYESGSDYPNGILGHDDIIKMGPQLVKDRPLLASIIAQKYPFFFVDESQDTFPDFVDALKPIANKMSGTFCLGFFGDPMQKIYMSGVGDIALEDTWKRITKPENFRCPTEILSVINNIRSQGDGLTQTRGRQQLMNGTWCPEQGIAKMFILPTDEHRTHNLERIRTWLAEHYSDPSWKSDSKEADVRILVIEHRMAAARLGFPDLFAAFNDDAPEPFRNSFREGTAWALQPFHDVLLPLSLAFWEDRQFKVVTLLRKHCPLLNNGILTGDVNIAELFTSLKENVRNVTDLLSENSNASVLDVLRFSSNVKLLKLDERLKKYVDQVSVEKLENVPFSSPAVPKGDDNDEEKTEAAIASYLKCPAKQVREYYKYINDESPYSTHQGIKGAEFAKVLVVLDDYESRHSQFSYDKLLGLKEPSQTDIDNKIQNKDSVFDRTRRLLYVCCSRATNGLAVALYSANVEMAATQLKTNGLFKPSDILTLEDTALPSNTFPPQSSIAP